MSITATKMNERADADVDNEPESQEKRFKHSYLTLDNISNDFLLQILRHLNIFDIVNLSYTCTRLHSFACEFIFPKLARQVELYMTAHNDWNFEETYPHVVRSDGSHSIPSLTMSELENSFERFGSFVEHLTLVGTHLKEPSEFFLTERLLDFENLLDMCPNLHTLCMENVKFREGGGHLFQHVAAGIKSLELKQCSGITNDWSEELKRFSKLEQITFITGHNENNVDFFKYNHLSNLTISCNSCSIPDLERIFNTNLQSIHQLKLLNSTQRFNAEAIDYQAIATLIIDKLPNLENLAIEDYVSVQLPNLLTELPHLKSLKLRCNDKSVNSLLRKLSDGGIIENLYIYYGVFDEEDENEPPLVFNNLQSCRWWIEKDNSVQIFRALTKSQMPAIRNLYFCLPSHTEDLLSVFESKKNLRTLTIDCYIHVGRLAFLQKLIQILNLDGTRPYLNLNMDSLNVEEVGYIF